MGCHVIDKIRDTDYNKTHVPEQIYLYLTNGEQRPVDVGFEPTEAERRPNADHVPLLYTIYCRRKRNRMPPKPKFTKEEIVEAALNIVSAKGPEALTARELGEKLGSTARPIFTVFKNMEEVQGEVRTAAMRRFESFAEKAVHHTPFFKQVGMQMVMFGMQEPKLYQLLFMQENQNAVSFDDVFGELGTTADICIDAICKDYGLSPADARVLFENVWIYTFGVGALCAMGVCRFSEERLGQMLSTEFQAMMMLMKSDGGK